MEILQTRPWLLCLCTILKISCFRLLYHESPHCKPCPSPRWLKSDNPWIQNFLHWHPSKIQSCHKLFLVVKSFSRNKLSSRNSIHLTISQSQPARSKKSLRFYSKTCLWQVRTCNATRKKRVCVWGWKKHLKTFQTLKYSEQWSFFKFSFHDL